MILFVLHYLISYLFLYRNSLGKGFLFFIGKYKNKYVEMKPYSSTKWMKLREKKLTEQPECAMCKCFGKNTPADQVHHIIKFKEQWDQEMTDALLEDEENTVSLCAECHNHIHFKPELVHPTFKHWLVQMKYYLCQKYWNKGMIIKWTEDENFKR